MKAITIKDIARKLGINHATVSRAIHNDPRISSGTKQKVLKAVEAMHYTPNVSARGLARVKSNTIAIVTPVYFSIYSAAVMHGIEPALIKTPYEMDYFTMRRFTSLGMRGKEVHVFEKILDERKAEALILISTNMIGRKGIIDRYRKAGIHVIFVEGKDTWGHRVHYDNEQAAIMAVNHLVERGHKRIGMLIGDVRVVQSFKERHAGFIKGMEAHGLVADEKNIYMDSNDEFERAREALNFFLSRKIDAVYVGTGEINSLAFYEAMQNAGVKAPDDMALVAQDDMLISKAVGLTAIKQPSEDMGRKAVEIAVKAIESNDLKNMRDEMFYPELIIRKTT